MEKLKSKSFLLPKRESIVVGSYVYFLFSDAELVYVGSTRRGVARVYQHINDKKFDSYSLLEVAEKNLESVENAYILKFNPKYNKAINISKDYLSSKGFKDRYGIAKNILNYMEKHYDIPIVENVANISKVYSRVEVKAAFKEMKANSLIIPYYVSSQSECRYKLKTKPQRNRLGFD